VVCDMGGEDEVNGSRRYFGHVKSLGNKYGFLSCAEAREKFERDVHVSLDELPGGAAVVGAAVSFCLTLNEKGRPQALHVKTDEAGKDAPLPCRDENVTSDGESSGPPCPVPMGSAYVRTPSDSPMGSYRSCGSGAGTPRRAQAMINISMPQTQVADQEGFLAAIDGELRRLLAAPQSTLLVVPMLAAPYMALLNNACAQHGMQSEVVQRGEYSEINVSVPATWSNRSLAPCPGLRIAVAGDLSAYGQFSPMGQEGGKMMFSSTTAEFSQGMVTNASGLRVNAAPFIVGSDHAESSSAFIADKPGGTQPQIYDAQTANGNSYDGHGYGDTSYGNVADSQNYHAHPVNGHSLDGQGYGDVATGNSFDGNGYGNTFGGNRADSQNYHTHSLDGNTFDGHGYSDPVGSLMTAPQSLDMHSTNGALHTAPQNLNMHSTNGALHTAPQNLDMHSTNGALITAPQNLAMHGTNGHSVNGHAPYGSRAMPQNYHVQSAGAYSFDSQPQLSANASPFVPSSFPSGFNAAETSQDAASRLSANAPAFEPSHGYDLTQRQSLAGSFTPRDQMQGPSHGFSSQSKHHMGSNADHYVEDGGDYDDDSRDTWQPSRWPPEHSETGASKEPRWPPDNSETGVSREHDSRDMSWKGSPKGGGGGKGVKPGDWECPNCGANVFASKRECFKCGAAKPYAQEDAYGRQEAGKGTGRWGQRAKGTWEKGSWESDAWAEKSWSGSKGEWGQSAWSGDNSRGHSDARSSTYGGRSEEHSSWREEEWSREGKGYERWPDARPQMRHQDWSGEGKGKGQDQWPEERPPLRQRDWSEEGKGQDRWPEERPALRPEGQDRWPEERPALRHQDRSSGEGKSIGGRWRDDKQDRPSLRQRKDLPDAAQDPDHNWADHKDADYVREDLSAETRRWADQPLQDRKGEDRKESGDKVFTTEPKKEASDEVTSRKPTNIDKAAFGRFAMGHLLGGKREPRKKDESS